MPVRLLPLVLVVLALHLRAPQSASANEPLRIRVLSYNIHHAAGTDGRLDLERIARVIRSVEPDLVALQEVDSKTRRVDGSDQPAELAKLTGLESVFQANIPYAGGEYGNAVLSRLPVRRTVRHALPRRDEGPQPAEQRGVLEVELALPGGEGLVFLATHLDHRRDDRERRDAVAVLEKLAWTLGERPAILAGDLNATPDSDVMRQLVQTWQDTAAEPQLTSPAGRPVRQIDYILTRPADRWKVVELRVLDEAVASDHRPIFAVLELQPERP